MLVNTKVHEAMVTRVKIGLKVDVRVDAFPDRPLKGRIKFVATVPIQGDWRSSSDVKMYLALVAIDETVPGLKPGMNAESVTYVDATDGPVLTIPLQAVVGGTELGATRKVFVKKGDGPPEEREVTVGLYNDKMVEIKSGLQEGDEVVMNPK